MLYFPVKMALSLSSFWLLVLLSTSTLVTQQKHAFDHHLEGWKGWGNCEAKHQKNIGFQHNGSLYAHCKLHEEYTYHKEYNNHFQPGHYEVNISLRGFEIQKGLWDDSVWIFYDAGQGTQFVVRNLKGTFAWSSLKFSLTMGKKPLHLWIRLKSQGRLWIDDISIQSSTNATNSTPVFLPSQKKFPSGNTREKGLQCTDCLRWWQDEHSHCGLCGTTLEPKQENTAKHSTRVLLNFEEEMRSSEKNYHFIRRFSPNASMGKSSAQIEYGKYNNIYFSGDYYTRWDSFDYIVFDVYNPTSHLVKFSVAISDKKASSYWEQLNLYTVLSHGWNTVRFPLRRYVGERGSLQNKRFLDLKNIQKFWFGVEPEGEKALRSAFLVDGIRLEKATKLPILPKGMLLFDFSKEKQTTISGFQPIVTTQLYSPKVGFGFSPETSFWKAHDSVYADSVFRDVLFVNQGKFQIDVPNGVYKIHLVAKHLGLWYEHFGKKGKIHLNGKQIFQLSRKTAKDYLKEFLRFQDIEPKAQDHPYDLYLASLFKPIVRTIRVRNQKIVLSMEGDASSIALNALILYPLSQQKSAQKVLKRLRQIQKEELDILSRKVQQPISKSKGSNKRVRRSLFAIQPVSAMTFPRPHTAVTHQEKPVFLEGCKKARPVQAFLVRISGKKKRNLRIKVSNLLSNKGKSIASDSWTLRYAVNQFMSHHVNHEAYELAPRFLRNLPSQGKKIHPQQTYLLWAQLPIAPSWDDGLYKGEITFWIDSKKFVFPLQVQVHPMALPELDFPVGYFGLDPVAFSHYKGKGVSKWKKNARKRVLQSLHARGFTTWTGLPEISLKNDNGRFRLLSKEVDELMNLAREIGFQEKIFTYGGTFLDNVWKLDHNSALFGFSNATFHTLFATVLKKHQEQKKWLPVVYNYSDEASGYSRKVEQDLQRAKKLLQYYPLVHRGGFTHPIQKGKYGFKLNQTFTDLSLSSHRSWHLQEMKKHRQQWGLYNATLSLFEDGRSTFGEGLFAARKMGLSHRLEWHATLHQNYPYYDLDGRENDAMMFFPRIDGQLDIALKLEWATMGLEDFRLLTLLDQYARQTGTVGEPVREWLQKNYKKRSFSKQSHNVLQSFQKTSSARHFEMFRKKAMTYLLQLHKALNTQE